MTEESPPNKGIKPEMLVGVSAVFIGVCALVVSLYETQLMREEQRSSVLPIVELARSHYTKADSPEKWRLSLHIENVGIGPALVRDFRVTVDGEPHPTWASAIKALLGEGVPISYGQSTINGRTVPAERMITMFDLSNIEISTSIVAEMDDGRLNFEACYCSVFDECWKTDFVGGSSGVTSVPQCTRDEGSFAE